jgi:uncharacterized BrkB/YihY/UPF0761 family membrane protein
MRRDLRRKLDQLAERSSWTASGLETFGHDRRLAGSLLAAGVAFRLFLMMLPLALLTAAALGFASGEGRPAPPADVARQYGLTFALASVIASSAGDASRGRWILLGTGLALLLWAGRGVAQAISRAFALAWGTEPATGRAALAMTLAVIGLLLTAVALTTLAAILRVRALPIGILATAALPVLYFIIFLLLSWALPHSARSWTALVPGSLLIATGLTLLQLVTIFFIAGRLSHASQLYGSLGIVSTLMLWLFLIGRMVVASAGLNATVWRRRIRDRGPATSRIS